MAKFWKYFVRRRLAKSAFATLKLSLELLAMTSAAPFVQMAAEIALKAIQYTEVRRQAHDH